MTAVGVAMPNSEHTRRRCADAARAWLAWALVLLGSLALGSVAWGRAAEFERRTVDVSGARGSYTMRYWLVGPERSAGHRVYVAASGVMTQADLLRPLARALAQAGAYVVAFDKLGFGSSHHGAGPLDYGHVTDAAHALVRYVAHNLEGELGVPADTPVHFAGLSLGASLVHAVGAERDPFVSGAAALAPPFNGSHPHLDAMLRWGMRADPDVSARWLNAGAGAIASLSQAWAALGRAAWPLRWMQQASTAAVGGTYDLLAPLGFSLPGTEAFRAGELLELAQALHRLPDGLLADLVARVREDRWPSAPQLVPTLTFVGEADGLCPSRNVVAEVQAGRLYDPTLAARTLVLLRGAGHLDAISERWRSVVAELMAAHLDHAAAPPAMRDALAAASARAAKAGHSIVGAVTDPAAGPEETQAALAPLRRILLGR
ncbi:MAG: alpha/beta hydrolase [Proteobacteria bacterium]|nr:alpha/beta hydrolase [Pseudomonadota bacterium]